MTLTTYEFEKKPLPRKGAPDKITVMNNGLKLLPILVLFLATFTSATGRSESSIRCAQAKLPNEKLICADNTLMALDRKLGKVYAANGSVTKQADRDKMKNEQKAWLKARDEKCKDKECLKSFISERISKLEAESIKLKGKLVQTIQSEGFTINRYESAFEAINDSQKKSILDLSFKEQTSHIQKIEGERLETSESTFRTPISVYGKYLSYQDDYSDYTQGMAHGTNLFSFTTWDLQVDKPASVLQVFPEAQVVEALKKDALFSELLKDSPGYKKAKTLDALRTLLEALEENEPCELNYAKALKPESFAFHRMEKNQISIKFMLDGGVGVCGSRQVGILLPVPSSLKGKLTAMLPTQE